MKGMRWAAKFLERGKIAYSPDLKATGKYRVTMEIAEMIVKKGFDPEHPDFGLFSQEALSFLFGTAMKMAQDPKGFSATFPLADDPVTWVAFLLESLARGEEGLHLHSDSRALLSDPDRAMAGIYVAAMLVMEAMRRAGALRSYEWTGQPYRLGRLQEPPIVIELPNGRRVNFGGLMIFQPETGTVRPSIAWETKISMN